MLARIALALGAFTLILGIFEVGFRIAGYRPLYEVYSKPSILWRHDAQLGWSHLPNSRDVYRGPRPWPIEYSNEIRINSLGLRGAELGGQGEDAYRILFLGDSMIAGFEVAELFRDQRTYDREHGRVRGYVILEEASARASE